MKNYYNPLLLNDSILRFADLSKLFKSFITKSIYLCFVSLTAFAQTNEVVSVKNKSAVMSDSTNAGKRCPMNNANEFLTLKLSNNQI